MRLYFFILLTALSCAHSVRDMVDDDEVLESHEAKARQTARHGPSRREAGSSDPGPQPDDSGLDEDEDEDAGGSDREKDAFEGTAEDNVQIEGAVEEFNDATKDAENKAKLVDKNFAKYNGRLGELQDQLRKLSAMARSYHLQTIKWFKNAEQDKYSPIANMPLDTFKISKSKDDFPLGSTTHRTHVLASLMSELAELRLLAMSVGNLHTFLPVTHFGLWLDLLEMAVLRKGGEELLLAGARQSVGPIVLGCQVPMCGADVEMGLVDLFVEAHIGYCSGLERPWCRDQRMLVMPWRSQRLSWPPHEVLAAERSLAVPQLLPRPLRVCAPGWGGCDTYSRGTGNCRISTAAARKAKITREPFQLVHDNCHGEEWDSRRKARLLHCPLNAPLAVRPVSKSGSLSVARWILQIDAPKARDLSLMASTWRPFEADNELYFDWASRWVSNRRTGSAREQDTDAKDMALRSRFGQESSGVILAASASSCLTCCRLGIGRLKVIFVRNPYKRLASAYLSIFLDRSRLAGDMVTNGFRGTNSSVETDFAYFLCFMASALFPYGLAGGVNDRLGVNFLMPGGSWATVRIMRSMLYGLGIHAGTLYEELNRTVDLHQFHVVHLENMEDDMGEMKRRLCQEFNFCRPLPPLRMWNSRWDRLRAGTTSTGRKARERQRQALPPDVQVRVLQQYQKHLMDRYRPDFVLFGYSEDPKNMDKAPGFPVSS
ncbi:unnamed protein product [Symbiodinium sp. CCMP2592]|nr:unnamed protein product [Symbiodinium sp. CCMP2592]